MDGKYSRGGIYLPLHYTEVGTDKYESLIAIVKTFLYDVNLSGTCASGAKNTVLVENGT